MSGFRRNQATIRVELSFGTIVGLVLVAAILVGNRN